MYRNILPGQNPESMLGFLLGKRKQNISPSVKKAVMNMMILMMLMPFWHCTGDKDQMVVMEGATQGTYYRLHVVGVTQGAELQKAIEQELDRIDQALSLWRPGSLINRFNAADTLLELSAEDTLNAVKTHFLENLARSVQLNNQTNGFFDPSLAPVIHYWGFGADAKKPAQVDSAEINRLLNLKGLTTIRLLSEQPLRLAKIKGQQVDFNAIAQGYTVDHLCKFLTEEGYTDFLVDIGGECRAKGNKPQSKGWSIGINIPDEKAAENEILNIITLKNQAISTSGNYRRFAEVNGQKVVHTIHPFTGMAYPNTLLSASVTHPQCTTADAWATALMAMGLEQAIRVAEKTSELGIGLIYAEDGQYKLFTNSTFPTLKQ